MHSFFTLNGPYTNCGEFFIQFWPWLQKYLSRYSWSDNVSIYVYIDEYLYIVFTILFQDVLIRTLLYSIRNQSTNHLIVLEIQSIQMLFNVYQGFWQRERIVRLSYLKSIGWSHRIKSIHSQHLDCLSVWSQENKIYSSAKHWFV